MKEAFSCSCSMFLAPGLNNLKQEAAKCSRKITGLESRHLHSSQFPHCPSESLALPAFLSSPVTYGNAYTITPCYTSPRSSGRWAHPSAPRRVCIFSGKAARSGNPTLLPAPLTLLHPVPHQDHLGSAASERQGFGSMNLWVFFKAPWSIPKLHQGDSGPVGVL